MTRKIEEVHRYSSGNAGFRRGAGGQHSDFGTVEDAGEKSRDPGRDLILDGWVATGAYFQTGLFR